MGKRKDAKGRVLKTGEGQRPNGTYEYRYTDRHGKRQRVYGKTLDELRKKEEEVQRDLADGIDREAGKLTVAELVDQYVEFRRTLKENSLRAYSTAIKRIHKDNFGQRRVNTVKMSDAKKFMVALHDSGLKYNTVTIYYNVLRPAFEMAVDDDAIRKNPFKFKLGDAIPKDASPRDALSKPQQEQYLKFLREYGRGNYFDDIEILLQTGLRVSELYGLTRADVDFSRRRIYINKQLCRTADRPYFITAPKTKSGVRYIPLTDRADMAFRRVLNNRKAPETEMQVDGYTNFIFLDKDGRPKTAMHLQNYMRGLQAALVKEHEGFPRVTPHVLRHTFCTNMQQAGIDVKSLQALMGHSNVSVTLDVYTHTDYNSVEVAFNRATVNL